MSRWFRLYDEMLDDPKVQRLPPDEFVAAFEVARVRRSGPIAPYLRPFRGRLSGPVWASLRAAVFERDGYRCVYCGKSGGRLECDHVVPFSKGGGDDLSNLATACWGCNRGKRDKLLSDWRPAQ